MGWFSSNHWKSPRGGGQGRENFPELASKTLGGILAEPLGADRASMGPLKKGGGSALSLRGTPEEEKSAGRAPSSALDPRASLVDASYSLGSSPWEPPATKRPRTQLPMGYCAFQPLSFLLGETGQIHQSFTLRIRVPVADLCLSLTIVCWV